MGPRCSAGLIQKRISSKHTTANVESNHCSSTALSWRHLGVRYDHPIPRPHEESGGSGLATPTFLVEHGKILNFLAFKRAELKKLGLVTHIVQDLRKQAIVSASFHAFPLCGCWFPFRFVRYVLLEMIRFKVLHSTLLLDSIHGSNFVFAGASSLIGASIWLIRGPKLVCGKNR